MVRQTSFLKLEQLKGMFIIEESNKLVTKMIKHVNNFVTYFTSLMVCLK